MWLSLTHQQAWTLIGAAAGLAALILIVARAGAKLRFGPSIAWVGTAGLAGTLGLWVFLDGPLSPTPAGHSYTRGISDTLLIIMAVLFLILVISGLRKTARMRSK